MPSQANIKFVQNTWDIHRLFTIHINISGVSPGRRFQLEVLNKSAIVLITACWEAYIEDVVQETFNSMLNNCDNPDNIPSKIKSIASQPLRDSNDLRKVWELAGTGWKNVLIDNKDRCLKKFIGHFNTPKPENIDELVENVLGLRKISSKWRWRGMSISNSKNKLDRYIGIRGDIAHRTRHMSSVTKTMAEDYLYFIERLANITDDCLRNHIHEITGTYPWPS